MSESIVSEALKTELRSRKTRDRADSTRANILTEATRLFAEQGYEGVSVRDIEKAAGVHRGLLNYHFDSKEALWKQVADGAFNLMRGEFSQRLEILEDMTARERLGYIIRFYVRFHSRHPEISRLMSQEARQDTWRIRYLIKHHIDPAREAMERLARAALGLTREEFIHWYYIMVSASSTIFSFAPECELLFGIDSTEDLRVKAHADMLVRMLLVQARPPD